MFIFLTVAKISDAVASTSGIIDNANEASDNFDIFMGQLKIVGADEDLV